MYGSLLTFLIAIVIQALGPRGPQSPWSATDFLHVVLYPVGAWLVLRFRFRRLMARALHDDEPRGLRVGFTGLIQTYQAALLVPFAILIYATRYSTLIDAASASSEVLAGALGILPFGLFLLILWWEAYPLQGVLFGRSGSRIGFVASHARMEFPVLLPWLLLLGLLDVFRRAAPAAYQAVQQNVLLQLLYAPVFLLLVGIFLPVLVKSMWGCRPMPPGPQRERLERLSARLGLKLGEILYWPLLQGKVLTAGIFGMLPRFRYLLITPALSEALTPAELDAVVAHEAGHIRHRHLWFYLLFFVGYIGVVAIFSRLAEAGLTWWGIADPEALRRPHVNQYSAAGMTLGLIVVLFFYFRVVFGAVSRAFERQADAYALTSLEDPQPLTSALERISVYSGDIRDLPSWHHGSIAERVGFLNAAARDPAVLARHNRSMRRLKASFAAAVAVLGCSAFLIYTGPADRYLTAFVAEYGLRQRLARSPADVSGRLILGRLYHEMGKEAEAKAAYEEVIRLDPRNAEALNNLAWLYVTAQSPELRRPERALELAQRAAVLDPSPQILDTLAEARFRSNDRRGALAAIDQALAMKPGNRPYYLAQRKKFLEGSAP